jgi:hypothetical protein
MPSNLNPLSWLYAFVEISLILMVAALASAQGNSLIELPLPLVYGPPDPNAETSKAVVDSLILTVDVTSDAMRVYKLELERVVAKSVEIKKALLTPQQFATDLNTWLPSDFKGRVNFRGLQSMSFQEVVSVWQALAVRCKQVNASCDIVIQARAITEIEEERVRKAIKSEATKEGR